VWNTAAGNWDYKIVYENKCLTNIAILKILGGAYLSTDYKF